MTASVTLDGMVDRIERRIRDMQPKSVEVTRVMTEIGLMVSARAKLNIRNRYKMVHTGDLLRQTHYMLEAQGNASVLRVGTFGIPYAAIHEYGGEFRPDMRAAMFANLRKRGRTWTPKGVIFGPKGARRFPERPYLRGAVQYERKNIIQKLRELLALKA